MESLRDKVCVVTGGASGIGRALVRRFAAAGMKVVIGDIEAGAIDATVAELRGDCVLGVRCDVRQLEYVQLLAVGCWAVTRSGSRRMGADGLRTPATGSGCAPARRRRARPRRSR